MTVQTPNRDPYAEELLVLHIVDTHAPASERQPYILDEEIDTLMKPHPGRTARGECFKYGWIRKPVVNKKVPAHALELTDLGREMMGRRKFAAQSLESKIAEEEMRMRQFRKPENQTNLPRLRGLRSWLRGEQKTWAMVEENPAAAPKAAVSKPVVIPPLEERSVRRPVKTARKPAKNPSSVLVRENAEA